MKLTIVGFYAPNNQQAKFWEDLCTLLDNGPNNPMIFMGCFFNSVLDISLDCSMLTRTPGMSGSLLQFKQHFQLMDIWREQNYHVRDYTHYAYSQGLYTCIDMIWVSQQIGLEITASVKGNCTLSDHALLLAY